MIAFLDGEGKCPHNENIPMNKLSLYFERLEHFWERFGYMPTSREFAEKIVRTKSKRQAQAAIEYFLEAGIIVKGKTGRLRPGAPLLGIRELGVVEAGFPTPAEEELRDTLTLDEWLVTDRLATYMLKVNGESMKDAGICPGDTALVERGRTPQEGDIVIACVDGKWTMKYYRKENGAVVLVPANKKFPKIYPKEELRIEAVVTAVIRKY